MIQAAFICRCTPAEGGFFRWPWQAETISHGNDLPSVSLPAHDPRIRGENAFPDRALERDHFKSIQVLNPFACARFFRKTGSQFS
jgi:hypothetical protein